MVAATYQVGELTGERAQDTTSGQLFIDLETCCRGPVEFDLEDAVF